MNKTEVLKLIDDHKNKLIDPVEMLNWTWLRLFILSIPEDDFTRYMEEAAKVASR